MPVAKPRPAFIASAALLALALVRCGTETPVNPPARADAGKVSDAPDAAEGADAGTIEETPDASETPDAGTVEQTPDAGTVEETPDASAPQPFDAGSPMEPPDAGLATPDGGPAYWTRVNADADGGYAACVGTAWPLEPEIHVPEPTPVTYGHAPPASGPHWPCWAPWATATKVLPPERWVHNLEHGGIVLLYRCEVPDGGFASDAFADGGSPCPDEAAAVQQFLAGAPLDSLGNKRYLVTAIPDMPHRFAAAAWGWTLETDDLDAEAFACFARAHLSQAPEDYGGDPYVPSCPQVYPP